MQNWEPWTLSQQKTLLGLCLVLLAFLGIGQAMRPVQASDPPSNSSARGNEVQSRLDPNTTDAATLSVIPNLGLAKAREIVLFRADFMRRHPGRLAFTSSDDLMQVDGIGPGVAANSAPFLLFPQQPATQP